MPVTTLTVPEITDVTMPESVALTVYLILVTITSGHVTIYLNVRS